MNTRTTIPARRIGGFSLIELMVGMVIGMVAIIVVMQVFALSEGSKRSILGGGDAVNNGAIALSSLQRDARQAGYGASALPLIGCDVTLPGGWTVSAMAPLTINHASLPAGDDNTDTVLVVHGSSDGSPEGDRVMAQPSTDTYAVATPTSFRVGDLVIAEPSPRPSPCQLTLEAVTSVASSSPQIVTVAAGTSGMAGGAIFNLGPAPRIQAYAVRGGNLTVCDYLANDCSVAANADDPTVWVPTGDNIVSLRAEYGVDTTAAPMDGIVDSYVRTTPTTACGWARVAAVQLAVVSRSGQFEKTAVTTAAPARADSGSTDIDLSGITDWQRYRYRLFEATVPLRNMAWQGAQAGC